MTTARPNPGLLAVARAMSEAQLQATIVGSDRRPGLAPVLGWMVHHACGVRQQRADGSTRHLTPIQGVPGYPDLTLLHTVVPALIVAELKAYDGRLPPAQRLWGDRLAVVPGVLYAVWRPLDLIEGRIEALLRDPQRVAQLAQEAAA